MENIENASVDEPTDKVQNIAKKLEEKTKEKLNPTEIKQMFNELGKDSKADNDLADIFYKSVKMI
ncbi:MAG: hypothetical protein GF383_09925, partial [Candidatus Lokiarchaeota archaeon]|nr:hypothetical protein [Candidatus Lokiarchaeota archaeon]MBD3340852.1 hypothetical protein [Candidatus Lokiarchaeota archaeon]